MRAAAIALASFLLTAPLRAAEFPLVPFYGPPSPEALGRYGTVVVQPGLVTRADVAALQAKGARVLGYVSIGEDDRLRRGDGSGVGGHADWYVDEFTGPGFKTIGPDGKPDSNADWGSYYVDASNRGWRRAVEAEVRRMKDELGMDGVFADTALVPRDVFTERLEKRMVRGVEKIAGSMKKWTGGGEVVVNNGWDLADRLRGRIDGILIETSVGRGPRRWDDVRRLAARLAPFRASGAKVSALIYLSDDAPADACAVLTQLGLSAALYRDDEAGRALTSLPLLTCP